MSGTNTLNYEQELFEEALNELSDNVKVKLAKISKTANIDMNTLWIAFISSMKELENELKREYM